MNNQKPQVLTVRLTPAQRGNLLTFLERTRLEGREAAALLELRHLFQNAKPESAPVEPKNQPAPSEPQPE